MDISFESDLAAWQRSMTDVEKRQLPFATALALTTTARDDVKPAVERRIEAAFQRPVPFTKRGVAYRSANKHTLVASVLIKDIQAGYLKLEETGGVRKPKGRALLVPVGQTLNSYGNLPKGKVKALLGRPDVFAGRVNGVGGIWKRMKGGRLKLLIRFEDETRYSPVFRFAKTAHDAALRAFPGRFAAAFDRAVRSARK